MVNFMQVYFVVKLTYTIYKMRVRYLINDWRRKMRVLFPSPAEIKFIRMFGGIVITIPFIKYPKTGFPLAIILTIGYRLRRENIQREVRVGAMYIDFASIDRFSKKAIEIDGRNFHRDIVREQRRDDYLYRRGWIVLHIQASDLYRNPKETKKRVMKFLAK